MFDTAAEAKAAFEALNAADQHAAWEKFSRDVDEGMSGWNPYYLYLTPLFWDGGSPFPEEDAAALAEYLEDLKHVAASDTWEDRCIRANDPGEEEFWNRFTPEAADLMLGCPA